MLYLALGVLAGAAWFAVGVGSGLLGASGAVMGMVGMFLVLFPANRIHSLLSWLTLAMLAVAIVWLATGNEVRSVAFAVTLIAVYLIGLFVLIPRALATGGSVLSEVSLIFLGLCTVRVTGIWLVLATVGFDVYYLVSHAADGVAHEAHIAGALAGVLLGAGLAAMGRIRGTTDEPTLYELLGFATPMASPERPAAAAPTPVAAKIPATRQYKRVPYRRQAKRREVPYEQWVAETRRIRRGGGKATRPRRQRHSSGSFAA
jgi:membrane associated rhomboid family serine protease